MFSAFRSHQHVRRPAHRPLSLRLEQLTDKIVPSAPSITNLSGEIVGSNIIVYGQESDSLAGQSSSTGAGASGTDTVTISGAINQTAAVSDTGQFSFVAPYTGTGSVAVYAQDPAGDQSPSYSLSVTATTNPAPVVTVQAAANNDNGTFTLSGTVYDSNPASLPVVLSGIVSTTVYTDSEGNFSVTIQPSQVGNVYVSTADGAGSSSNTAEIAVGQAPPTIGGFGWTQIGPGSYVFTGQVTSPTAPGSTVTLQSGNIPGANGATGTVDANGNFVIQVSLPDGFGSGSVSVSTTDPFGQQSNAPSVFVTE
jgi:hypothetical protein